MAASTPPQRFVLASSNPHKLREFTALLAPHGIAAAPAPEGYTCEEDGETFADNALRKAQAVRATLRTLGEPRAWVLADDSGLAVDALGGAPGVRSARYADPVPAGGDQDAANRAALAQALRALGPSIVRAPAGYAARFVCALVALAPEPDAPALHVRGELCGYVGSHERGTQGFGYDCMFVPQGERGEALGGTLAELGPAVKDSLSHRARALLALLQALRAR